MRCFGLAFGAVLLAAGVVSPTLALAQEAYRPWYIAVRGSAVQPIESKSNNGTVQYEYQLGGGMSAALGYDPEGSVAVLGNSRFEVEGIFQSYNIDSKRTGGVVTALDGDVTTTALMFNVIYDLPVDWTFRPYFGGGVGLADVTYEEVDVFGTGLRTETSETVPAWQLKAGVQYASESLPELTYGLGYKAFVTQKVRHLGVDVENSSHHVELGARLNF